MANRKTYKGFYTPLNPHKYVGDINQIVFRSLWERKFMLWCDQNPSVLKWGSEIHPIPYYSSYHKKVRRYFADFFVRMKNKDGGQEVLMIEIKPNKERYPPKAPKNKNAKAMQRYLSEGIEYQVNQDKWKAAEEFAAKHNMKFVVLDEYALGIKKKKNEKTI